MIQKIIAFSVRNKVVVGLFMAAWIGWGTYSLLNLPLNTLPDLTNNQVKVTTYSPDLATEEVERLITYPIEMEMGNLPGLKEIRSISKFGLSDITLVFEEDMGMYKPRQLVKEKLVTASRMLPPGVGQPVMGPMTSGLGEIYQYVLSAKPGYDTVYDAMSLRSVQDWIVRRELVNIEGVVGVNTMGGYLKQYEVAVEPSRLRGYNLTIMDIYDALQKNNANTGGSYIEKNRRAYFVRGEGLTRSLDDIRAIGLKSDLDTPLTIGEVAEVRFGSAPRYGAFTYNGRGEAVGGKIMMLRGENPAEVINNVKERLPQVREALPEGVEMTPFLDRSTLIGETTHTVTENLMLGALIVIFVLILLMGSLRSGILTASVIPLSLLFALGVMYTFDFSANLISLGAIDFGIIIDGAVIIIEFTVFQISRQFSSLRGLKGKSLQQEMDRLTIRSSGRMMRTAFFGQLIILVVFIPILTLTGQEGDMFKPMAITFGSALIGAIILCLTYVPMMSALILRPARNEKGNYADRMLDRIRSLYRGTLRKALRYRYAVIAGTAGLFVLALITFARMGSVFIPKLDEGDFAIHPILQPGTSLSETVAINTKLEQVLLEHFPAEVEQVATKIGTGEIPTDPMSLEMAKMIINLAPRDQWKRTDSKEELEAMMKEEMSVRVPGITFFFSQPIEMLFNHLVTGSSADLLLNIYGSDLDTLFHLGNRAADLLRGVPGAGDLNVQKVIGLPQVVIRYDRDRMARYGLDIESVNQTIQAAYSGARAGTVYEGEEQYDQVVRLTERNQHDPDDIRELYIRRPSGSQVRLGEIADVTIRAGPAAISREGVKRKLEVDVNIGDRDTESFVREVQQALDENLDLPRGYRVTYEGEFESLQSAKKRLSWVVPLVLAFIFILLFFTFGSFRQSLLVFTAVPLAATGGVFSLWIRGMPFSISAAIGFIALFGIAVLNGVVLMSFFNELREEGVTNVYRRIYRGTDLRLRPVILTALTDALGFLPMAISASSGAEVQRPLATVVVGGLITATLLTLVLLPVIYSFSGRTRRYPSLREVAAGNGRLSRKKRRRGGLMIIMALVFMAQAGVNGQQVEEQKINTMQSAVQVALENHPRVKADSLDVVRQETLQPTAWDLPGTRFSWEHETEGAGVQSWSVDQSLNLPMEYMARSRALQMRTDESQQQLRRTQAMLARSVRLNYTDLLHAREKVALLEELEHTFRDVEKAGRLRYETGEVPYLERISSQARYREIGLALEKARTSLENQRRTLGQLLGVDKPVYVMPESLAVRTFDPGIPGDSLSGNPELRWYRSVVARSRAEGKMVRSASWPNPFVRYSWREFNPNGGFHGFEVGLSVPLDLWSERSRNNASRLATEQKSQEYRAAERRVQTRYRNTLKEWETASEHLEFYRNARLQEARMILKSATEQFRAGNIDYLSYVQYFNQATNIQLEYLETVRYHNAIVIELEYLLGK